MGQKPSDLPKEKGFEMPEDGLLTGRWTIYHINPLKDYISDGWIARGAFGEVYRCHQRGEEDRELALKMMTKGANDTIYWKWQNEVTVLRTVKGLPFLMQIEDNFDYRGFVYYCIVTKFITGITLDEHVHSRPVLHSSAVRFYLAELLVAISLLHEKRIIHRDIKPKNILLDVEGHIVLTDFGESVLQAPYDEGRTDGYHGTIEYFAPETVQRKPFNHMLDWWAFAVTAHSIATAGELVFGHRNSDNEALLESIVYEAPAINPALTTSFQELLRLMLRKSVKDRLGYGGVDEIKSHPFFETVDWSAAFGKKLKPPSKIRGANDDE